MIKRKTVLILGAGASAPYRFPLGRQLLLLICSRLRNITDVAEARFRQDSIRERERTLSSIMLDCGYDYRKLDVFRRELELSMQPSIDAFLENSPEYVEIGKAAIAASLIPYEQLSTLTTRESDREPGWYEYLFNQMGARKEEFQQNKLAIVTFNYDRSLEYLLFTALKNSYHISEKEAADLLRTIPIIHVYGQLGKPHFREADGRPYTTEVTQENVKKCTSEMKIIHEQSQSSAEFDEAHVLLEQAQTVCFLGFGYHTTNIQRLRVNDLLKRNSRILFSVFRLGKDEIRRVTDPFEPLRARFTKTIRGKYFILGSSTEDALSFLKNHPVFD